MVRTQERTKEPLTEVIYLDTHIVAAVSRTDWRSLTKEAQRVLNSADDVRISPMVVVEWEYLYEIGQAQINGQNMVNRLGKEMGLRVCDLPFWETALQATHETWTSDGFDRIIVAQARLAKAPLLTRDERIRAHYNRAIA